jgi:hypothetical protein
MLAEDRPELGHEQDQAGAVHPATVAESERLITPLSRSAYAHRSS